MDFRYAFWWFRWLVVIYSDLGRSFKTSKTNSGVPDGSQSRSRALRSWIGTHFSLMLEVRRVSQFYNIEFKKSACRGPYVLAVVLVILWWVVLSRRRTRVIRSASPWSFMSSSKSSSLRFVQHQVWTFTHRSCSTWTLPTGSLQHLIRHWTSL